ncbi:MAG: hypothetical protein RBR34_07105 [Rhodospirillaceae bacterium]|nr:hypothetical protein [Rhodospirillaceae bacterium]
MASSQSGTQGQAGPPAEAIIDGSICSVTGGVALGVKSHRTMRANRALFVCKVDERSGLFSVPRRDGR